MGQRAFLGLSNDGGRKEAGQIGNGIGASPVFSDVFGVKGVIQVSDNGRRQWFLLYGLEGIFFFLVFMFRLARIVVLRDGMDAVPFCYFFLRPQSLKV
jgi:hypothetical protein